MRAIVDSDVLIDYLQGENKAKLELDRYPKREISIVSWMEIMAGADSEEEEKACRGFLNSFIIHQLTMEVASEAVNIRKEHRIRLPDAIVWATARNQGCLLVTRNTKDFAGTEPGIRFPYEI
jgi:hypothetical protein